MVKCACCNFVPELNTHHNHLQGDFATEEQECVDDADMLALKMRSPEGATAERAWFLPQSHFAAEQVKGEKAKNIILMEFPFLWK